MINQQFAIYSFSPRVNKTLEVDSVNVATEIASAPIAVTNIVSPSNIIIGTAISDPQLVVTKSLSVDGIGIGTVIGEPSFIRKKSLSVNSMESITIIRSVRWKVDITNPGIQIRKRDTRKHIHKYRNHND